MPIEKNFKRQVRRRMSETNERYTTARANLERSSSRQARSAEVGFSPDGPAVRWLLDSAEPAIRYRTLTEVLGRAEADPEVRAARAAIPEGPKVREIFAAQNADGTWGADTFKHKYTGLKHVLRVLSEFRVPGDDARLATAIDKFVADVLESERRRHQVIGGRVRDHIGARDGVALDICTVFGRANEPSTRSIVDHILATQWPDGGWNCDRRPRAKNSSFIETFDATRALFRYHAATGDERALDAATKSTEIFLKRGIIRAQRTGNLISGAWLQLHWPRDFDVLFALEALTPAGLEDPRLQEALDLVESRRRKDGLWRASGRKPPVARTGQGEVADFSDGTRDQFVTLRALSVLRAAGRLGASASAAPTRKVGAARRRTRKETLSALLADAGIDFAVESIELLNHDEDGTHSRVSLENGDTCIFREYDTTSSMANKFQLLEAYFYEVLPKAGLPTTEVLASITGSPRAGGDRSASLLTDAPGQMLESLFRDVSDDERSLMWQTVAHQLRLLHDADPSLAGSLATPRHTETGTTIVATFAKLLNRLKSNHPEASDAADALLEMRPLLRKHFDARPRAIRFSGGIPQPRLLPGMLLDRDRDEWRCNAWLGWGYWVTVAGDPMRDVVGIATTHLEWLGEDLPDAFYSEYGARPDRISQLVYGFREPWREHANPARRVPPPPFAPGREVIDELPALVDELHSLLAFC